VLELPWERLELDPVIFMRAPASLFLSLPVVKNNPTTSKNLATG